MTSSARSIQTDGLTALNARVLSAYFGLLAEGQCSEWIGGQEIRGWIQRRLPDAEVPSESTVVKTLQVAGLVHRGRGQPRRASRVDPVTPPFSLPGATKRPRRSDA